MRRTSLIPPPLPRLLAKPRTLAVTVDCMLVSYLCSKSAKKLFDKKLPFVSKIVKDKEHKHKDKERQHGDVAEERGGNWKRDGKGKSDKYKLTPAEHGKGKEKWSYSNDADLVTARAYTA